MSQANLYPHIDEVDTLIFHSDYQDLYFQRNILAACVISLTSLCLYLIFTRTSPSVKNSSNKSGKRSSNSFDGTFGLYPKNPASPLDWPEPSTNESARKKESMGQVEDEDSDENSEEDAVDSFMKNMRSMTTPKNEVSRAQQQLSSNVKVEAFGTNLDSMMGKFRSVAVSNQETPEKAELVENMFGLMEGVTKNFMSQQGQASVGTILESIIPNQTISEPIVSDDSTPPEPNPSED